MRRDEFLLQAIVAHQFRVGTGREDQPIIAAKKERRIDFPERSEPGDQRVFQRRHRCRRFAGPGQVPAQEFPCVTVHDKRQGGPTVLSAK